MSVLSPTMWHWLDSKNKPTLSGLSKTQPMNWRLKIFRKKGAYILNMCRHFRHACFLDNTTFTLDTTFTLCWLVRVTCGWSELFSSRGLFANSNVFYIKDLSIYGFWNPPGPETYGYERYSVVHLLPVCMRCLTERPTDNSVMEWVKILSE